MNPGWTFVLGALAIAVYAAYEQPTISGAQSRALLLLAQRSGGLMYPADLRDQRISASTVRSMVRRGWVTGLAGGGCRITDSGRQQLGAQAGSTGASTTEIEYEPHPFEPGGGRDRLDREQCNLCLQLAGRRVHMGGEAWS